MIYDPNRERISIEWFIIPSAVTAQFLAAHNLSSHQNLARMGIEELRTWYEAVAYSPRVNSNVEHTSGIDTLGQYESLEDLEEFII